MNTATHLAYIRVMHPSDFARVTAIAHDAFGRSAWGNRDTWDALYVRRDVIPLVAECAGVVVGWEVHMHDDREFRALALAVHSQWRYRNVGRSLLADVASRAKQCQAACVVADVIDDNVGAQKFLRAIGWRATKVLGRWYRFETQVREGE